MNQQKFSDPEEKEMVESYEKNEWRSIDHVEEEKQKHSEYAKNTFLSRSRRRLECFKTQDTE